MWRCARCGARNDRQAAHCARCGMASPFADDDRTRPIDVPAPEPEQPDRHASSVSWIVVAVAVVGLLALLVVALIALAG